MRDGRRQEKKRLIYYSTAVDKKIKFPPCSRTIVSCGFNFFQSAIQSRTN